MGVGKVASTENGQKWLRCVVKQLCHRVPHSSDKGTLNLNTTLHPEVRRRDFKYYDITDFRRTLAEVYHYFGMLDSVSA